VLIYRRINRPSRREQLQSMLILALKELPDSLRAMPDDVQAAAQSLLTARRASAARFLMAIEAGIDVIDHGDDMDDECIAALAETGTFVAPSVLFPKTFLANMGAGLGFSDQMRADLDRTLGVLPQANAAGVKLVVGDDYGAVGFAHGRYAEELEVYVRDAGIPALEVLRWATKHGAELMGRAEELGTVAEGKLADLLVVDGDPLEDVRVLQDRDSLLAIVKDGVLEKDELAQL